MNIGSGQGLIKPQEDKIAAVRNYPGPTTKSQVRAFLDLSGYYRCLIPNFSSLACPLTDLTWKQQPEKVQWSPATEKAFQSLKKALIAEPVLQAPDFTLPFILQMDASDYGLGVVLSQEFQSERHPVLQVGNCPQQKSNMQLRNKRSWPCSEQS